MKTKKKLKNEKGITLIALVITIIVLLILAGISISMLTGQNGILNRAQEAKEKTEVAGEDELRKLTQMQAAMNLENTTHTDNSTGEEITVTIPAQCAVSQVEGENTLKDGLVIIDTNGNEWVWIEVPDSIYARAKSSIDFDNINNDLIDYVGIYRKGSINQNFNWKDQWYEGNGIINQETYISMYQKMLTSIYINSGFWVGRYEAGIEGSISDLSLGRVSHNDINNISPNAIIQKDAIPYNFIDISEAQFLANKMSPNNIQSTSLMFGIQWDLLCKFLEVRGFLAEDDINENSSNLGSYKNKIIKITSSNAKKFHADKQKWEIMNEGEKAIIGDGTNDNILITTGSSEETKVKNIYDIAGNLWEFTLEKTEYSEYPTCKRGGSFVNDGDDYPISIRSDSKSDFFGGSAGFRPTLY